MFEEAKSITINGVEYRVRTTSDGYIPAFRFQKVMALMQKVQEATEKSNADPLNEALDDERKKLWLSYCSQFLDGDVSGLAQENISTAQLAELDHFFALCVDSTVKSLKNGTRTSEASSSPDQTASSPESTK